MKRRPTKMSGGVSITIPTPVLDKMLTNKGESQAIGNFLAWLQEHGIELAEYSKERRYRDMLVPKRFVIEELLAEYFDVDLAEAERERQKILKGLRI